MNKKEIKKFYSMACLYDQVGEPTIHQDSEIEQIMKLGEDEEWTAINVLFNEDQYETANELFDDLFDEDIRSLNLLADKFGFENIKN